MLYELYLAFLQMIHVNMNAVCSGTSASAQLNELGQ